MIAYAKHLPAGAAPASNVRSWGVEGSERWRKAGVPIIFAPAAGSWLLGVLVIAAFVLGLRDEGPTQPVGTAWRDYPAVVLLAALPLWYRLLPAAAAVAAAVVVGESAVGWDGPAALPVCVLSLWALAGALLRLLARRRQERLALAAAGTARYPLPETLPRGHDRRGNARIVCGALACLAAAGILVDGLVADLGSPAGAPYDAAGQQGVALVLLVLGTTVLGWGWSADLGVRRLYADDQPALVVGVRISPSGHFWLLPDADGTTARPLLCYRPVHGDTLDWGRLLARGSATLPQDGLHDVDARAEPFEAVLYGVPREGAEVVLEYAVYDSFGTSLSSQVAAVRLLPRRRHRLGPWSPAGASYRESTRGRREREEAHRRERDREAARRRTTRPGKRAKATATGTAGTTAAGSSSGSSGCGGGGCGGGSGGCGGCGGGCGGCGCG